MFKNHSLAPIIGLLLWTFTLGTPALAGEMHGLNVYDTDTPVVNPLDGISPTCAPCAHVFRVVRPLFPLINHVVVGVVLTSSCSPTQTLIYGASKGPQDLVVFNADLQASPLNSELLEDRGWACGPQAFHAMKAATEITLEWRDWLKDPVQFAARMAATPLLGRVCNQAAAQVLTAIADDLAPTAP